MINNTCVLCQNTITSRRNVKKCSVCQNICHVKCWTSTHSSINEAIDWYCMQCNISLFPFNGIEDDSEFYCITSQDNDYVDVRWLENISYSPVDIYKSNNETLLEQNDPDNNFYCDFNVDVGRCQYYTPVNFNNKCKDISVSAEKLSLFHVNIRSFPKNINNWEYYLMGLDLPFSCIGVSETWFTESNCDLYSINGYENVNLCRKDKKGGGVSIFVKENINFKPRKDLNISEMDIEAIFVEIINSNVKKTSNYIVGNI